MTEKTINIIHLPARQDRLFNLKEQLKIQGYADYKLWDGIIVPQLPFKGICQAHKNIVREAQQKGLKKVIIAEDDIMFTHPLSMLYYMMNEPADYDLFLGGIYNLEGQGGTLDKNNRVTDFFCSMTLYMVHERFYDFFLSLNEMNNIDREISKTSDRHKYIVCNPLVCYQSNGISDHKRKYAEYDHLLKGRKLFGIEGS